MDPPVSVIVVAYNEEGSIRECVRSVLDQSFRDFELIIVDGKSDDKTPEIIRGFRDSRIRYFQLDRRLNIPESRNLGLSKARGEFVFFTDADCYPTGDWISQGLGVLKKKGVVGVEGKTVYVSEGYRPSVLEYVRQNEKGGLYLTCNIAYRRALIERAGVFDVNMFSFEDVDMGLRMKGFGDITFCKSMLVYHSKKEVGLVRMLKDVIRAEPLTRLAIKNKKRDGYIRFGIPIQFTGRVISPYSLFITLFPFMVLLQLLFPKRRIRGLGDIIGVPLFYIRTILIRAVIWKTSISLHRFYL